MGFFRNIAFKTAVKKGLLDITSVVKRLQETNNSLSFGDAIPIMIDMHPQQKEIFKDIPLSSWEEQFFYLVIYETKLQLMHDPNFGSAKDNQILLELVGQWIIPYGGNPDKLLDCY